MKEFKIQLPLNGAYMTTVRLTTGGICAECGFDIDKAEDFKVCVTESLLLLRRNRFGGASISFSTENGVTARIAGLDKEGDAEASVEDEISYALLGALTERADFTKEDNRVTAITLSIR